MKKSAKEKYLGDHLTSEANSKETVKDRKSIGDVTNASYSK